jgi:hypothetical protein
MIALDLLQQLHKLGVSLTPSSDGTLRCRAPKGVLTPALVEKMREHKPELHGLVESWSERAAIAQYCGGHTREEAERLAWQCVIVPHAGCAACGLPIDSSGGAQQT